jgi:hypothetical protein
MAGLLAMWKLWQRSTSRCLLSRRIGELRETAHTLADIPVVDVHVEAEELPGRTQEDLDGECFSFFVGLGDR